MSDVPCHLVLWVSRILEHEKMVFQTEKIQTKVPDSCKVLIVGSFGALRLGQGHAQISSYGELQDHHRVHAGKPQRRRSL